MSFHHRKLKQITFTVDGQEFACQVQTWNLANNTEDGEKIFSFCGGGPEGESREDADPDYSLELTFYADWRSAGVSDWAWINDGRTVDFTLEHHPDIPAEHVTWTGQLKVKAPSVGGDARSTEMSEVTWACIGKPTYTRAA